MDDSRYIQYIGGGVVGTDERVHNTTNDQAKVYHHP